ncbi:FHA domain-containing protein [Clostridium drakei]|uniref:FHA domain-containing protein n=1 Tax=Clostridium drakei TaxID=332101 RepID=A0A2U8DQH1_9CLOT|nr:FHA domain-containing protein [Clostridium drakei]AWI05026.1 hypothetical protein B9W14_11125 [Clostridium drakei]
MDKYKVCPSCGEKNAPQLLECIYCETDLSSTKVLDEVEEQIVKQEEEKHNMPQEKMVRICDCGTHNIPQARKCSSCGEDISDTQPVLLTEKADYSLVSIDDKYTFKITKQLHIIGRENDMSDYLQFKPYVSRTHAKLTLVEDDLYITNLSQTNFTYVNNEKLVEDIPRLLKDGDEVGLGGMKKDDGYQEKAAYFIVRNYVC